MLLTKAGREQEEHGSGSGRAVSQGRERTAWLLWWENGECDAAVAVGEEQTFPSPPESQTPWCRTGLLESICSSRLLVQSQLEQLAQALVLLGWVSPQPPGHVFHQLHNKCGFFPHLSRISWFPAVPAAPCPATQKSYPLCILVGEMPVSLTIMSRRYRVRVLQAAGM